jgi:hypothetical protein
MITKTIWEAIIPNISKTMLSGNENYSINITPIILVLTYP